MDRLVGWLGSVTNRANFAFALDDRIILRCFFLALLACGWVFLNLSLNYKGLRKFYVFGRCKFCCVYYCAC